MIALRDVSKAFGAKQVLRGVTLDIPEGMNTAIIGGSGTGKSVTLKCIVGLVTPDAGTVTVDGQDVAALDRTGLEALRATIGYVFQFAALFDSMTVAENIALGLRRRGMPADAIAARTAECLALVGLAGSEERLPAELSGGMRKRVGIARAVALRPRYILYDEPTTGLDPITTASMDDLMRKTRDLGVTGVVVTHDMRSAFGVADRIAMLHEGRIRQVGTPDEMRASGDPLVRQFIEGWPEPRPLAAAGAR